MTTEMRKTPRDDEHPRLTTADILAVVGLEEYHQRENTQTVICILTLRNGFQVTGKHTVDEVHVFDENIAKQAAYAQAFNKIWMLEGYLLKERMYQNAEPVSVNVTLEGVEGSMGFGV